MTDPLSGARRVGVMLPRDLPVADVLPFARRAEELGFDELWVVEDLGFRGGIAQAAAVLAVTERITVGIGILPAAVRTVTFAAMEVSTLEQLHPGRLVVGIGHGMPDWMRSVGAWPERPLAFLKEYAIALAALLRGEVPPAGRHVDAGGVRLTERPDRVPPILLGVRGPRSVAAAGTVADGVVLAEPATPAYVAHARRLMRDAAPDAAPRIVTYDLAAVADDAAAARDVVRSALGVLRLPDWRPHLVDLPFEADLLALAERASDDADFVARLPDAWVDELTLAGTADAVRGRIAARHDAGAAAVVLVPLGPDRLAALTRLGEVLGAR